MVPSARQGTPDSHVSEFGQADSALACRGRNADLLSALNASAAALQSSSHSEEDIFAAVRREVALLGLRGGVAIPDEEGRQLVIRISNGFSAPAVVRKLEALTDRKVDGFRFDIERVPAYKLCLSTGAAVYVEDSNAMIAQMLPPSTQPLSSSIVEALGHRPCILAPLSSRERILGVLAVAGPGLVPEDIPALEAFAHHITMALENARLIQELRDTNRRLEADIASRQATEMALRESEARFRSAFENAAVGMALLGLDGRFLQVNQTLTDLLGYSEAELNSVSCSQITHPDDVHIGLVQQKRLLAREARSTQFDKRYLHNNGSSVWMTVSPSLVCDDRGQPVCFVTQMQDITDHKRNQVALRHSEQTARTLLDATTDLAMLIDLDGVIIAANAGVSHRLGKSLEALQGQNIYDDLPAPLAKARKAQGDKVARTGKPARFVDEREGLVCDNSVFPIFDEHGAVHQFAVFSHDVTEQRRALEERHAIARRLQEAQKLESLGVLAGGIAHDFNNLLVGILGNAELVAQELPRHAEAQAGIRRISVAATSAADLCRQMLTYSGRGKASVELLDLNSTVTEMKHLLASTSTRSEVVRYQLAESLPSIRADATQIRQVIMNMTTNGCEALSDPSGDVVITTGVRHCDRAYLMSSYVDGELLEGDYVFFQVTDTGVGMDEQTVARMFDPFFTTKFAGRGLGLAALLGIVRSHGGAVRVRSEPGKGTTVKVLFPAAVGPAILSRRESGEESHWQGSGVALVVDDDELVRQVASSMLCTLGFEVLVARDGPEALSVCRQRHDLRCVLLDLTMPRMGGEETLRQLRKIRPELPVVLSSGFGDHGIEARDPAGSAAGFLVKPYNLANLQEVLEQAL